MTHTYTPKHTETLTTNRGIAIYDGAIIRGATDGHLYALDASTGEMLWDVRVVDSGVGAYIGVAPIVYKGLVFAGMAGAEYGIRGQIFAFEAKTGKLVWTFNAVPGKGEPGYETWEKGAETGGGSSWTSFTVDPATGTVFAPIGNPSPDFGHHKRPGSNLYTNSVVALDAATGKLRWYVQQVPADYHDYDTAAPPVIYDQGKRRYIAVGSKDGNVYIYDRDSRKLLSKTPVTTIKNVELPLKEGKENKVMVCPGPLGGVEWYGPAYDPKANALFVGANDWCADTWLAPSEYKPGQMYLDGMVEFAKEQTGWLKALDATTGKELWSYHAPKPMIGGVTPTAGGVVLTGGANGEFLVFDAKDGKILYRFNTGGTVGGGVSTYSVGGRQYVAVASGTRSSMPFGTLGSPSVFVFALPETAGR